MLREVLYQISFRLQRIQCWFVGHDERWGGSGYSSEPNYCARCWLEWPENYVTLYKRLNWLYCWVVERHWGWFDALDEWLYTNHPQRLPRWWEY